MEIQEAPISPCSRLTCTPPFFAPSLGVSLFCLAASVSPAYHLTIPAWCVLVLGHLCSHLRFLLTLISRDFWSFHPGLSPELGFKVSSFLVLLWHFHEVERCVVQALLPRRGGSRGGNQGFWRWDELSKVRRPGVGTGPTRPSVLLFLFCAAPGSLPSQVVFFVLS